MSMNYLLYGADTFRSRRKLREIIDAYRQKAGTAFSLHRFDAEEDDLSRIPAVAGGRSLFEQKSLIVVERPFTFPRQFGFVAAALELSAKDKAVLILLWDGAVGIGQDAKKMLAGAEALAEKTQVFDMLKGDRLARWIQNEAHTRGLALTPAEVSRLSFGYGGDLWALSGEIEKRVVGGAGGEVRDGGIGSGASATVFQLGDVFLVSPKDALMILHRLIAQGEDAMRLFAYLAGYARTLLVVRAYLDRGSAIAPGHGIHPFVAKKAAAQVRTLPRSYLARVLTRFYEEDVKIKTGLAGPEEALVRMVTLKETL